MERNRGTLPILMLTAFAPLVWGSSYVTVTELLPDGRPLFVAALRVVPAGVLLVVVSRTWTTSWPRGREWLWTAGLALANFGLFFPLLTVAIYRLPGGLAASVGGLQPLLVLIATAVLAGTMPTRLNIAVGVAAAVGVSLVVLGPGATADPVGIVAAVGANVSFALGVVLTRLSPEPGDRWTATGLQMSMSALLIVPLSLVLEGLPPVPTAANVVGAVHIGLVATGLAFVLWFNGIRKLPPIAPPLVGLLAPITGATLGWLLLGESLGVVQLAGFAITFGAIGYGAIRPALAGRPGADRAGRPESPAEPSRAIVAPRPEFVPSRPWIATVPHMPRRTARRTTTPDRCASTASSPAGGR